MPIIDLQMRMRQLGEIRLGHVVPTSNGKTRPAKLDKFRFTSPSREILTSVAELYGGEVKPWTPANGGPAEFEVYSTVNRLPVLIPPRDAVSQWYELYAGSKCQRRCDGVTEQKTDRPCMCDPENRDCAMTTRVNVMLRDVPALGQWLLVSKGYHAAVTLPPAAELLSQAGGYVAGWLGMEEKSAIVKGQLARFKVPTLDVEITPGALMAGEVAGGKPEVAKGPERAAIGTGPSQPPRDFLAEAKAAATQAEALAVFQEAKNAGAPLDYQEQLKAIGLAKPVAAPGSPSMPEQRAPEPDAEGVYDVEFVDDPADVQAVWFQIIAAAGQYGLTTDQVEAGFAQRNGGTHPSSGTVAQMNAYLAAVKAGEVA
ncbi:recombination directionality factor [Streptomyces griseorubiginosus]|uniref:recombination directionality factor n=1 Tax=Streptomyces griseorubiginosus TaxID=67304 RepID=UPI0036EE2AAE